MDYDIMCRSCIGFLKTRNSESLLTSSICYHESDLWGKCFFITHKKYRDFRGVDNIFIFMTLTTGRGIFPIRGALSFHVYPRGFYRDRYPVILLAGHDY